MQGPTLMTCRRVSTGHWVGVLTLVAGLCLSLAGVVSPWWRTMDDDPRCSYFEGLWQQCSRCVHSRTQCSFSDRHAGPWHAIQALELLSLLCLALSLVLALTCAGKRRCQRGKCPIPALAALIGGLTGLLADLLFVGYIERYVAHTPEEHLYAWSFALAITGALLSLLSSLLFSLSKALCPPKFSAQSVQPYWPYNHCMSLGVVDPSPLPPQYTHFRDPVRRVSHYPTIPEVSPEKEMTLEYQEAPKYRLEMYEQYLQGKLQFTSKEGGDCHPPLPSPRLVFKSEKEAGKETLNDNRLSDVNMVQPPVISEVEKGSCERNEENKLSNEEQTLHDSAPRVDNKPDGKETLLANEAPTPSSPGMVSTLKPADQPVSAHFEESNQTSVFTVEKALRELRDIRDSREENPRHKHGDQAGY